MTGAAELRQALRRLRETSGLPVAFGGLSGPHGLLISETDGTATTALDGLAVSTGTGVGGKAVVLARPVTVTDYRRSRTISHEYDTAVAAENLYAILAVPVIVGQRVRAVLYGALRRPLALGDRTLGAADDAARQLARDMTACEAPAAPGAWEEVRAAHADLRALARRLPEGPQRAALLAACARLEGACAPAAPGRCGPALTPRETDVLAHVAVGATNAAVATRLGVRPETVKAYLRSAMRKLGAHTRLEAVVAARRAGALP